MLYAVLLFLALLSTFQSFVLSAPSPLRTRSGNTLAVQRVSSTTLNGIAPIALFSQAAYCSAPAIMSWACGPACLAHPTVIPLQSGGDDGKVPGYFIAFDPVQNSIIVAHQGTEPEILVSDINDIKFFLKPLDSELFPNAPTGVKVHDGFQETFLRTAKDILATVQKGLKDKGAKSVTITGHSLGAAIGVMDSVFLRSQLSTSIPIRTTVFGLPRTGNQAWADFVDSQLPNLQHLHKNEDIVPQVPPHFLGFQHPKGELFIHKNTSIVDTCPGQENENCSAGNNLFDKSILDHFGPYAGVRISTFDCTL